MNLIGEKVLLRAIEISDKEILRDLINDPETEYYIGGWSFPVSDFNQEEWIKLLKNDCHKLRCMVDSNEGNTLGTAILSDLDYKNGTAEIHIKLLKKYQQKGFGVDIINTLVTYAFQELRLQCIYAYINAYNLGSKKLFEKAGFQYEATLRNRIYKSGKYHNLLVYSIIIGEAEWK